MKGLIKMSDNVISILDKFKHGDISIEDTHRAIEFNGRTCDKCKQPAAMRIRTFGELAEVMRRSPEWVMQTAAKNNGALPVVEFTYGKFIRVGEAYACEHCRSELEREAAKAPSWVIIEIDRGKKDGISIQVPESFNKAAI